MTQDELQFVMKDLMSPFNNEDVDITDETVINEVVSHDDGFEGVRSAPIFKNMTEWTLHTNGHEIKQWPDNWLSMTVKNLSAAIICFLLFITTSIAQKPLHLTVGAAKTENKQSALQLNIAYIPQLTFSGKEKLKFGQHSVFSFTPNIEINTGTDDAMSSIVAKVTGLDIIFKTKKVGNITMPDVGKVFHTLPFSIGVESSNRFSFLNAIAEAGWVPWYQGASKELWVRHTKFGLFIQAGYKFGLDSSQAGATGGEVDQSQETRESGILRARASIAADTKAIVTIQGLKVGLAGTADIWYDVLNTAFYHRIVGSARVYLTGENYIDFRYEHGAGAPLFNDADQIGVGLTLAF